MKSWKSKVGVGVVVVLISATAQAAIVVEGADGSDGALVVTNDVTIDLSLATTGVWDDNNAANTGNGVYDAEKWAVVFKYSSVVVSNGATLTFQNHPSKAPVVWLVNGDVTIDGTVSVNGGSYKQAPGNAEPGPGGFRGGMATLNADTSSGTGAGSGFGMGGAKTEWDRGNGGSYGSRGSYNSEQSPDPYGNISLIPLIGGSGGASDFTAEYGGGGGGGAILIASTQEISVSGKISADGGAGARLSGQNSGGGSGGGIRLICDSLIGNGEVGCAKGYGYIYGGLGRIRLERVDNSNNLTVAPDPSILGLEAGTTALLWPPDGAPEVRIVSVNGETAPADPRADFGTTLADVALAPTNTAAIVVETTNVEPASQVFVRVTPRHSNNYSQYTATLAATNSLSPLTLEWEVNESVNVGYSAVQVRVVRP